MPESDIEKETNSLTNQDCDVLIVGAGISGLISAREILKADPELKVLIIEGKDRVGGRTHTIELKCAEKGTEKWDIGGQWVGRTQTHIIDLIKELGLETYDQYTEGIRWMQMGNAKRKQYTSRFPMVEETGQLSFAEVLDFLKSCTKLKTLIESVDVKDFLSSPNAREYDAITIREWFQKHTNTRCFSDLADMVAKTVFGVPAERISFLYFLVYIKSGGSLDDVLDNTDTGADSLRVSGGTQQISQKLCEIVGWDNIHLNQALLKLRFLDENDDNSLVEAVIQNTLDETKISKVIAKRVILAVPPVECSRIRFQPSLPFDKKQFFDGCHQGNYLKFIATYETPFWRKKGFSGEIFSTGFTGNPRETRPLSSALDATTDTGKPALVGFFNNETWSDSTPEVRKEAVLRDMAKFLGNEALKPLDYADKDWGQEMFTGGCPTGVIPAGNMGAYARAREPWKTIHFGGTEMATVWIGYMSGAVQSGLRASHEVLLKLGSRNVNWDYLEDSFLNPQYKPQLEWDNSYKKDSTMTSVKAFLSSIATGTKYLIKSKIF
ncbi:hypothetical protein FO519_009004 [Halicephalobus sp. NKZ332]|nr:hypothetical protein FO519_009004 [Halicephalobus sp. NKZ332]